MSTFWLVSLPLEGSRERTWSILQDKTTHDNDLSVNYKVRSKFRARTPDYYMLIVYAAVIIF